MAGSSAPPPRVALFEMSLQDHLTEARLLEVFAPLTTRLNGATGSFRLLVDCRRMTGYDAAARNLFVSWNRTYRNRIERVAILTDNRLWHMVISAMSLATRQAMRPFPDPEAARTWLSDGAS